MQETSRFQIVLLGALVFFIVIAVLIFATFQSGGTKKSPAITTWGVLPRSAMQPIFDSTEYLQSGVTINYIEKDPATFDRDFVEALAEGQGPDLILIPQSLLFKEQNKLSTISYNLLSARDFKDTYIQSAEVLLKDSGVIGIPFAVDPLILYWNRTNFTDAGVPNPPKYWEDLGALVPKLTVRDQNLNIKKSAIALGSYQNITNAKNIIASLILQSGNPITAEDQSGEITSQINSSVGGTSGALDFYTSFSDAAKANYSWNRALPSSALAFSAGNLAMYIGLGSEINSIRARNPNLNFDVAPLPQVKGSSKKSFANLYIFAVPKQSRYPQDSYTAASVLASSPLSSIFIKGTNLSPARRDLLSAAPSDPYKSIFYDGALSSALWQDPDPDKTSAIFGEMIDSITSGQNSISESLSNANDELNGLLNQSN